MNPPKLLPFRSRAMFSYGKAKCIALGLHISEESDVITLTPFNTKQKMARISIQIPKDQVQEVVAVICKMAGMNCNTQEVYTGDSSVDAPRVEKEGCHLHSSK